jgi:hypothetical protein
MLEHFYKEPRSLADFRRGLLGSHFDGFAAHLKTKGYSPSYTKQTLSKCCQLNYFLSDHRIKSCDQITESLLDSFLDLYLANIRTGEGRNRTFASIIPAFCSCGQSVDTVHRTSFESESSLNRKKPFVRERNAYAAFHFSQPESDGFCVPYGPLFAASLSVIHTGTHANTRQPDHPAAAQRSTFLPQISVDSGVLRLKPSSHADICQISPPRTEAHSGAHWNRPLSHSTPEHTISSLQPESCLSCALSPSVIHTRPHRNTRQPDSFRRSLFTPCAHVNPHLSPCALWCAFVRLWTDASLAARHYTLRPVRNSGHYQEPHENLL